MTVAVKNDNKTPLIVPRAVRRKAGFKSGEELEFKASEGMITIIPKGPSPGNDPIDSLLKIIEEAKRNRIGSRELAVVNADLMAYGSRQAKKFGIKESDIPASFMNHAHAAARLKAVLDTNIYVSAFAFEKGRTAALWRAAVDGRYRTVVSPAIIRETARVLRDDFGWSEERTATMVRTVAQVAEAGLVAGRMSVHALSVDPDDNRILECAAEGKADVIVSNDHHLLDLKIWNGIPILERRRLPPDAWAKVTWEVSKSHPEP